MVSFVAQHDTLGTKLAQRSAADKTIDCIINQLWQSADARTKFRPLAERSAAKFWSITAKRSAAKMWSKKSRTDFQKYGSIAMGPGTID